MRHLPFPLLALLLAVALAFTAGCTPRHEIASSRSLYVSGRADFNISVKENMTLAAAARFSTFVPSDVTTQPSGRLRYALFTDNPEGPVTRHAHVLMCELPREQWEWEKETWAKPEALSYEKDRQAGKYWTIQMFPVFSSQDWFSKLWQANGREIPDFWLARRWSSTPEDYLRIVAEYREPAPLCMRERLADAARKEQQGGIPLKGKELWRGCDDEIREFTARADAAFIFDRSGNMPSPESAPLSVLPAGNPDMAKLVGKAEYNETFSVGSRD